MRGAQSQTGRRGWIGAPGTIHLDEAKSHVFDTDVLVVHGLRLVDVVPRGPRRSGVPGGGVFWIERGSG